MALKVEAPSLREIEQALTQLWTRRDKREQFFAGQSDIHPSLAKAIDHRGVKLYASLIDLGRLDLMASIYPLCKKVLGKHFNTLVHEYMETMPPDHFNLNQSARKFSQFLATHAEAHLKRHPFLAELADYEWIELAVIEADVVVDSTEVNDQSILQSESSEELDLKAFAASVPRLNGTVVTRCYKYPISEIAGLLEDGEKLPRRQKAQASWLLAYRGLDHSCHYLDVSELTLEIVAQMAAKPDSSYGELIGLACSGASNVEEVVADFLTMIEEFKTSGVIL
ncbi:hypothetical protein BH11CYA1_BH11CYA1_19080 [soil metagenome]